jgi:hypothetical protein
MVAASGRQEAFWLLHAARLLPRSGGTICPWSDGDLRCGADGRSMRSCRGRCVPVGGAVA